MAELSERDKQLIFGEKRASNDLVEHIKEDDNTPAKKLASFESQKLTAIFLALTGLAVLVGNFFLSGPVVSLEKALSGSLLLIGVVWFIYLGFAMRRLRASVVHAA